jgi:hypothetical protein
VTFALCQNEFTAFPLYSGGRRIMRKNDHDAGKTRERESDLRRCAKGFTRFHELSLQHSVANCGRIIL